jgi:hypothetical protein
VPVRPFGSTTALPVCAGTGQGLLPARHLLPTLYTDCSVVDIECLCCPRRTPCCSTSALRTMRRLLHARYLAFRAPPGSLRSRRFPPCAEPGSLLADRSVLAARFDRFGLLRNDRIVLSTFCLGVCAGFLPALTPCSSHRPRIASRSTLGLLHRARIAPISMLPALRCLRIAPPASLSARTGHESLRARHLAFRTVAGSILADCSVLAASRPASIADCSALDA